MNLYLVSRKDEVRYDEYAAFVCRVEDEETAINTSPKDANTAIDWGSKAVCDHQWTRSVYSLRVALLATGVLGQKAIILASYNGS